MIGSRRDEERKEAGKRNERSSLLVPDDYSFGWMGLLLLPQCLQAFLFPSGSYFWQQFFITVFLLGKMHFSIFQAKTSDRNWWWNGRWGGGGWSCCGGGETLKNETSFEEGQHFIPFLHDSNRHLLLQTLTKTQSSSSSWSCSWVPSFESMVSIRDRRTVVYHERCFSLDSSTSILLVLLDLAIFDVIDQFQESSTEILKTSRRFLIHQFYVHFLIWSVAACQVSRIIPSDPISSGLLSFSFLLFHLILSFMLFCSFSLFQSNFPNGLGEREEERQHSLLCLKFIRFVACDELFFGKLGGEERGKSIKEGGWNKQASLTHRGENNRPEFLTKAAAVWKKMKHKTKNILFVIQHSESSKRESKILKKSSSSSCDHDDDNVWKELWGKRMMPLSSFHERKGTA